MTSLPISPLGCVVLAGGQSRRMGTDKALIDVDGVPLLRRVVDRLHAVSEDVFIVGDRPAYHHFGVPVIKDAYPGTAALGGIATALVCSRLDHVLVVACDMPFLNINLLRAMASEPRDYDALVPVLASEPHRDGKRERFETLHAIYGKGCLPAIEEQLAAGELKVADALQLVELRTLDREWVRRFDPELRSFVNVNRPQDLAAVAIANIDSDIRAQPEEG